MVVHTAARSWVGTADRGDTAGTADTEEMAGRADTAAQPRLLRSHSSPTDKLSPCSDRSRIAAARSPREAPTCAVRVRRAHAIPTVRDATAESRSARYHRSSSGAIPDRRNRWADRRSFEAFVSGRRSRSSAPRSPVGDCSTPTAYWLSWIRSPSHLAAVSSRHRLAIADCRVVGARPRSGMMTLSRA